MSTSPASPRRPIARAVQPRRRQGLLRKPHPVARPATPTARQVRGDDRDDPAFYTLLAHGADGGILASAHLATERFVAVHERMVANDHRAARSIWSEFEPLVPLLFKEANPMPIKYLLWRRGLIASPECRLPLTRVSGTVAEELDRLGELVLA